MSGFSPCLVAPVYNHGALAQRLAGDTQDLGLMLFLIDDASTVETASLEAAATLSHVRLLRHEKNQGKGGAVMTGLRAAYGAGFTHALQIDADGQHAAGDIPAFLSLAKAEPDAVICGRPVFDKTVPLSRLIGRYVTHVWIWIETLSLDIKDSMCGFRVYPLGRTIAVLDSASLGRRMDFDPEILVRLHWTGVSVRFFPTKVVYLEGGRSNFRLVSDNWLITCMHTRLFFGMLLRLPQLFVRRLFAERP